MGAELIAMDFITGAAPRIIIWAHAFLMPLHM